MLTSTDSADRGPAAHERFRVEIRADCLPRAVAALILAAADVPTV
ncbi:hypothetical protein [Mycolicibacterium agri]|nr:hypothetical protein [Mycolicibacterium agri]